MIVGEGGREADAPEGVGCAAVGQDFTQSGRWGRLMHFRWLHGGEKLEKWQGSKRCAEATQVSGGDQRTGPAVRGREGARRVDGVGVSVGKAREGIDACV